MEKDTILPVPQIPDLDDGVIDKNNYDDDNVNVFISYAGAEIGDTIRLYWDISEIGSQELSSLNELPVVFKLTQDILTNGAHDLSYSVTDAHHNTSWSDDLFVYVMKDSVADKMVAPLVVGEENGTLDLGVIFPDDHATVEILASDAMSAHIGNELRIKWDVFDISGKVVPAACTYLDTNITETDTIGFNWEVPMNVVVMANNNKVKVSYYINVGSERIYSEELIFNVTDEIKPHIEIIPKDVVDVKIGEFISLIIRVSNTLGMPVSDAKVTFVLTKIFDRQREASSSQVLINGESPSMVNIMTNEDGLATIEVSEPKGVGVQTYIAAYVKEIISNEQPVTFRVKTSPDSDRARFWGYMTDVVNGIRRPFLYKEIDSNKTGCIASNGESWAGLTYDEAADIGNLPDTTQLLTLQQEQGDMGAQHGWPTFFSYHTLLQQPNGPYYVINLSNGMIDELDNMSSLVFTSCVTNSDPEVYDEK